MIISLLTLVLIVVIVTLIFRLLECKTAFRDLGFWPKQILIGVIFGAISYHSTVFGVLINGVIINVRDAAPLCAGLFFGAPAGIIAGLIGGVTRWFAASGDYTRLACSISTILAGVISALLKTKVYKNSIPSWLIAFLIGVGMEILHLLIAFATHASEVATVWAAVSPGFIFMVLANGLALLLSALVYKCIKSS